MKAKPPSWLLGAAMVVLELLAGMQAYVSSTVTPLLAAELGGTRLYGRAMAAVQAAVFLALPLSPALIRRWSGARVLVWLTPITVLCAVVAAAAPSMEVYIGARFVGALGSGAMAGVGMGIIATQLTGRVRQLVLAAGSAMWVVSSLVGPGYAAWISAVFSWRWALVAYLPVLVAARWVIVRELRGRELGVGEQGALAGGAEAPVLGALVLAGSVLVLGLRPPIDAVGAVLALLALVGVGVGLRRVLPRPVLTRRPHGAPAAVRLLFWLSMAHYGADGVISIVAHDLMGFDAVRLGGLLMVGGVAWALLGVATGARPASAARAGWQLPSGLLMVFTGLVLLAVACQTGRAWLWVGWVVVNLGMGAVYLDCLNLAFGPVPVPGMDAADAGMVVVMVESVAGAVAGTLGASLLSGRPELAWLVFALLAVAVLPGLGEVRRASITA
ncbi:MFS transporter [Luteococcus sp. H138]|uniref:MFS transporter n=1 Tax=unclassified Luteococcus TaxID=2639923 RepID=UPI00313B8FBD